MEENKIERKVSFKKRYYMVNIPMIFAKELNLPDSNTVQFYKNEKGEIVIAPVAQQEQEQND